MPKLSPVPPSRVERWPRPLEDAPLHVARATVLARIDSDTESAQSPAIRRAAYLLVVLLDVQRPLGSSAIGAAPWEHARTLDLRLLAATGGLTVADAERAVELLARTGVLVPAEGMDASAPAVDPTTTPVTLARDLFVAHPTADAVAWDVVLEALAGNAAAILTVWAFAELLRRPDRFASIPRAALQAHTLYSEGMIKRALAAVVSAGLVERESPNAYRLTDRALGRGIAAAAASAPVAASPALAAPAPAPPAAPSASGLVTFTAAGIPLALPRDTTVELETEIDGKRTTIRLRFPST